MDVLHVIPEMCRGGAERIVLDLVADGVSSGRVAVASGGGAWASTVEGLGGEHNLIGLAPSSASATLRSVPGLARVIRRFRPDVVHAHNMRATVAARAAATLAGRPRVPMVSTFHGGAAKEEYPTAVRLLKRATPRLVACSPATAVALVHAGFPEGRLDTILNGAALDPATPSAVQAVAERYQLPPTGVVVAVGRLVPQKGWPDLVDAAARIRDLDVPIVVAGEGPLRAELAELAREAQAPIRFVGPVDDVPALLGSARAVVSSSLWEGLPMALMEALSLGLPAVATAVDGVLDILDDELALLVPPGDAASLADALRRILTDPHLAAQLGERAAAASSTWSPALMRDRYRDAYRRAVARGAA
jgi:glycosyltransferase involved in cell wall biosynthesis